MMTRRGLFGSLFVLPAAAVSGAAPVPNSEEVRNVACEVEVLSCRMRQLRHEVEAMPLVFAQQEEWEDILRSITALSTE